jgi:uncharacterized protein (TIGR03437 family)
MKYAFVFLLATALPAQISNLTTTANGSELEFISVFGTPSDPTSVLRHYAYSPQAPVQLFRADNPYFADQPLFPILSDDGQTRGLITYRSCFGPCMFYVPATTVDMTRNGKPIQYKVSGNNIRVSRNGRWIFHSNSLHDVDTGSTVNIPSVNPFHLTHSFADDGTFVSTTLISAFPVTATLPNPKALRVFEKGRPEPVIEVGFADVLLSAAISQNGRKIFALTKSTLYELDRQTRTPREIYTSETPLVAFSLSASGNEVLVHNARQAIVINSGIPGQIYESPDPIQEILLSSDGQSFFVLTRFSRLTRVTNGLPSELYPPFPGLARQTSSGAVPGSLLRLSGGPFPDDVTVTVQGRQFPKIASGANSYEVQIPWDFPIDAVNTFLITRAGCPFAISDTLTLQKEPVAAIYTLAAPLSSTNEAKAVQSDFRSLISPENPAPAGSTIHFWLTGLGPLDRPLATAEPGPIDQPAKPLTPFACYIIQGDAVRGLQIPFAAYAPGLLGVYQIDAVVPADWPAGQSNLTCAVGLNPPVSSANIYVRSN